MYINTDRGQLVMGGQEVQSPDCQLEVRSRANNGR